MKFNLITLFKSSTKIFFLKNENIFTIKYVEVSQSLTERQRLNVCSVSLRALQIVFMTDAVVAFGAQTHLSLRAS